MYDIIINIKDQKVNPIFFSSDLYLPKIQYEKFIDETNKPKNSILTWLKRIQILREKNHGLDSTRNKYYIFVLTQIHYFE